MNEQQKNHWIGLSAPKQLEGIAQGAVYLHKLCEPRIIHGDLKPGNILLDASLKPKICDFGISKALKADADKDCTGVVVGSR